MKISKATIIRTILVFVVLLNSVLEHFGLSPIKADENTVNATVQSIIEVLCVASAWWYNNSFSSNALKAQDYLEQLRKEDTNV